MHALIVNSDAELARLWQRTIQRSGARVTVARSQNRAIGVLQTTAIDIIVLDLALERGSALAVADFAGYRQPDCVIVPVTSATFFSDGSVFKHIPNTCASIRASTPPDDVAAIVEHYGGHPA